MSWNMAKKAKKKSREDVPFREPQEEKSFAVGDGLCGVPSGCEGSGGVLRSSRA